MTSLTLKEALARLIDRSDLAESEAYDLLIALTDSTQSPAAVGAALAALESKRANADELRGFARAMRALAIRPRFDEGSPIADIAGTGGDGSGSLNLSTGAALLAAACGVRIAKHGNRSVSSRSGSTDVLEALGMRVPADEREAAACLRTLGFSFLHAPYFHPAMKTVAPVRAALGVRTVFNLLGPLTNPAAPRHAVVGAFSPGAARLLADAFAGMPIERVFVVHGANGWDEPTPAAPFTLLTAAPGHVEARQMSHADFGLPDCPEAELVGGDAGENARRLKAALSGEDGGGARHAIAMGAALVLVAVGKAPTPRAGAELALAAIDNGSAGRLLARLAEFRPGGFDVC